LVSRLRKTKMDKRGSGLPRGAIKICGERPKTAPGGKSSKPLVAWWGGGGRG